MAVCGLPSWGQISWTQQRGGMTSRNQSFVNCTTFARDLTYPRRGEAGDLSSGEVRRQENLWRRFFQDPTLWWDNRKNKKSGRSPDFRDRQSQGVLWLNKFYKPAWVDAKLAALDMGMVAPDRTFPGPGRPGGEDGVVTAGTVSKLCDEGHLPEAVEALEVLVQADHWISKSLFYTVLRKCAVRKDLVLGSRVHALTVRKGYQSDTFLCNHILRMYASHGKLRDAMDVFEGVAEPDAFTWSAIIYGHVKHRLDKQAIGLYHRMRRSNVKPDGHVFVAALQACARVLDLETGQQVHADVLAAGVQPALFVRNCLVNMYAKCGSLEDAQGVFDGLDKKDVVTWTAMIAGYSQHGMGKEALRLYGAMQDEGMAVPNAVTFVCLLQACATLGTIALEKGKLLHAQIREQGCQGDVFVASSLVNMYAKCGSLKDAQRVFDGLHEKDLVTWTAMIAGYSQQGMGQEALSLYCAMKEEGIAIPDSVTFVCLLQACATVGTAALLKGKQLHAEIRKQGHEPDLFVASSLVNMYAQCGSLDDARRVFERFGRKDVVSWNAMIAAYSQQDMGQEALHLYSAMQEEGTAAPDAVTFVCLLQACASVGPEALDEGKQLHVHIKERGHEADGSVANSLVNMYAKCGSLVDAQAVFDGLGQKDVVTWTAMIAGYSEQGMGQEALRLYSVMRAEGMAVPNSLTFVCLLQACANVAALNMGRQLHAQIVEQGLQADVFVAGSLINMYAKSGSMVGARRVFDVLPKRDIVVWNALIAGYSSEGNSEVVFDLVHRMGGDAIEPDSVTFISVLAVCSHAGLVNKGWEYFRAMTKDYSIPPMEHHYTCMVDLLGRAGQLDEALGLAMTMPVQPNAAVWRTLLGSCRKWGNVEVGRLAFNEAVKLDKRDAAAYVLMSNIYIGAQMWEGAQKLQETRKHIKAWKQPGQSWWTDEDGLVHSFLVGDDQHMLARMKKERCVASGLVTGKHI